METPTLVSNRSPLLLSIKRKNEEVINKQKTYFTALFIIGLFNNNGYVLVAGGAANLASDFNKENLMPMFQL